MIAITTAFVSRSWYALVSLPLCVYRSRRSFARFAVCVVFGGSGWLGVHQEERRCGCPSRGLVKSTVSFVSPLCVLCGVGSGQNQPESAGIAKSGSRARRVPQVGVISL